jgi:hypothetical protein
MMRFTALLWVLAPIRFKMLQDHTRIQLDLYANLTVEKPG